MVIPWWMVAPTLSVGVVGAATELAVVLPSTLRRRDFLSFEDRSKAEIAREFDIPSAASSDAERRRDALAPLIQKSQDKTNRAQTTYYNAVVRSAGCLVLAFLALAFGSLRPPHWPVETVLTWQSFKLVLSWIEVVSTVLVLVLFLHGRVSAGPWIADRARTELLRQYQFLSLVFDDPSTTATFNDLKSRFDDEAHLITERVHRGAVTSIAKRVGLFWDERRAKFEQRPLAASDLGADSMIVYLRRRVRRQLGWFRDSKVRLDHIAERRHSLLLGLYGVTVMFALIKHAYIVWQGHASGYLTPVLLIATGLSAAMTAAYLNQNSRSLIHRYNTQERSISKWLLAFRRRWAFDKLATMEMTPSIKVAMREQVLLFEDLMIEELIDWIQITSKDAIDL